MSVHKDNEPFPKERILLQPRLFQSHHGYLVGGLVANHHLHLHAVVIERIHQPVCRYGGSTRIVARVYYQYSHRC